MQVQSKHIKILEKKKKKKNKQTKTKTELKPTGILEEEKIKKRKEKVHLINWINQKKNKKHYSWAFGSFYMVNRYVNLHKKKYIYIYIYKIKKTQTNNWKKKKL